MFLKKVKEAFEKTMEKDHRNVDKISSKWRDIRLKVVEFSDIYHSLDQIHKSWSNDFDVYTAALDQYKNTTATFFLTAI